MPFAIKPSPEIWHRDDFPLLCNWRCLWRAAEIGVDRGEFAHTFLSRWQGDEYWGVDSYKPYPEMPYSRDSDYLIAIARLERHGRRAKLLKDESIDAARFFSTGSLDFVYLDAAHDYWNVEADLNAWWPIVSNRGILAGHDWTDKDIHAGVKMAVTKFATDHHLTIYVTKVDGYQPEDCPSWYLYKSGMPGSNWKRC